MTNTPPRRRILLVEPHGDLRTELLSVLAPVAVVHACSDFETARAQLESHPPDLLFVNLRLRAYNGIHLALVVQCDRLSTRTIVYADEADLSVAPAIQMANAFFELTPRFRVALPAYATARLPASDRRNPRAFDRRSLPRGGRRRWDRHMLAGATTA